MINLPTPLNWTPSYFEWTMFDSFLNHPLYAVLLFAVIPALIVAFFVMLIVNRKSL